MTDNKVYLTDEGFLELEEELNELKNVKRPAVIKALKEARALGDLSENADYDAAFEKAISSTNDDEKTTYYKECERILSENAANVYIQDLPEFVALNKKYTGYEFYPLYIQDIAKIRLADE